MKGATVKVKRNFTKHMMKKSGGASVVKGIERRVNAAQKKLLREFESHPVTREIDAGPESPNISGTLGGSGNLFSFLGFYDSDSPMTVVRSFINSVQLKRTPKKKALKNGRVSFEFDVVTTGTKEELFNDTRLSWLGKSWLKGVESGLSGLGYYLYLSAYDFPGSRSGVAIQSKPPRKVRNLVYRPTQYISALLRGFKTSLKKIK
jgi:hypothetical protein